MGVEAVLVIIAGSLFFIIALVMGGSLTMDIIYNRKEIDNIKEERRNKELEKKVSLVGKLQDVEDQYNQQFEYAGQTQDFVLKKREECRELYEEILKIGETGGLNHVNARSCEVKIERLEKSVGMVEDAYDTVKESVGKIKDQAFKDEIEACVVTDPMKAFNKTKHLLKQSNVSKNEQISKWL